MVEPPFCATFPLIVAVVNEIFVISSVVTIGSSVLTISSELLQL